MASPNTFAYFLHVLRFGQEQVRIEENAKKVWELLTGLEKEAGKFGEVLGVLSSHLTNAKNTLDKANNEYGKLTSKFEQVRHLEEPSG
jgi:DNA anti-recombination protein RmuC